MAWTEDSDDKKICFVRCHLYCFLKYCYECLKLITCSYNCRE